MTIFVKSLRSFFTLVSLCLVMASSLSLADEPGLYTEIVNINTADAGTLASHLNGVGEKKAQAIVEYRKAYGSFKAVDELAEVKGIGPTMVELNRSRIVLE